MNTALILAINLRIKPLFFKKRLIKKNGFDLSFGEYTPKGKGGFKCFFGFHDWEFFTNGFKSWNACGCGATENLG